MLLLLCGGIYFYTNNLKQKDNNTNTPVTEKYKNSEDFVAIEDYYVNDVTIKKVNFKNLDTSLIKDFTPGSADALNTASAKTIIANSVFFMVIPFKYL